MTNKVKAILLVSACAFMVALTACGSSDETVASKDYVYSHKELPASAFFPDGATIFRAGDDIYMYGSVWDSGYESNDFYLVRLADEGSITETASFGENFYSFLSGTADGRIFALKTVYPEPDDLDYADDGISARDMDMPIFPGSGESLNYLVELSMDGRELAGVLLNDNPDLGGTDYFYVSQMMMLPDDVIMVQANETYAVFGADLSYRGPLKIDFGYDVYNVNLICLADGRVIVQTFNENNLVFYELNTVTGALGAEIPFNAPGNTYSYSFYPGVGWDILATDGNAVYGYNLGQEATMLMNFVDSDLNTYSIYDIVALSEQEFWGSIFDMEVRNNVYSSFVKVPPEDVEDKINITLAGSYVDWDAKGQVIAFNKASDKYRISIVEYSTLYNTNDDWTAGATRLNNDIAAGRAPDILFVSSDLPMDSYVGKGMFADLLPYIEKDPELDVADLMPSVVEAYSLDGKMYTLVPRYIVETAFGKTSLVGAEQGWTITEAEALVASQPPDTTLFEPFTIRSSLLSNAIRYGGNQYINWDTGQCYFKEESFMDLLEFLKPYPEEVDYSLYDDNNFWMEYESIYRDGRTILLQGSISSLRSYNSMVKGQFGEAVTMIGFPGSGGNGSIVTTYTSFAMNDKSKNKDGIWEFMRYYLTDEYQMSDSWMLPISRRAYDKLAQEAMQRPFYIDEVTKEKVEYDDVYYINDMEVPITPMTAAEVDYLTDFILSVTTTGHYDETVLNIITEEAGPYFAGQKSVQEVADIIQSRVQIYVNENR